MHAFHSNVSCLLDQAILAGSHAGVFANPDYRLDRTVVRSGGTVLQKELRFDIGAAKGEYARFLLLATGEEMVSAGRDGHRANDVVMRERVKRGAVDGIPDLSVNGMHECFGCFTILQALTQ